MKLLIKSQHGKRLMIGFGMTIKLHSKWLLLDIVLNLKGLIMYESQLDLFQQLPFYPIFHCFVITRRIRMAKSKT